MHINELPAGREMDALIGKLIRGGPHNKKWAVLNTDETSMAFCSESKREVEEFLSERLKKPPDSWLKDFHVGCLEIYKPYSTDIAAAWELAEKIKFLVLRIDITISVDTRLKPYAVLITGKGIREWWQGEGDSLPLAICRAALLALGVTEI